MITFKSTVPAFQDRLSEALRRLPLFMHLVLATHIRTTLSNLPRWAHGHRDIPAQRDRRLILKQLDEFLSWPDEVFSHVAMLVRIDRPDLTNLLAVQLGVTAEEIYLWSEFKQLPNHARRADVMEQLMRSN